MLGFTSKLQVLGIYTFSQRSCILSAHRGLQGHTNCKTPEQAGLVLLPESIRLVSDVSWHPRAVQRRTTHAQRYPGYVLALRHIPTWIFTIFVQYFHIICFGRDIITVLHCVQVATWTPWTRVQVKTPKKSASRSKCVQVARSSRSWSEMRPG